MIQPVHGQYVYVRSQAASYTVFFEDRSGSKVYKFECHDGDYDDDSEMNFSGVFHCALFPYRGDTVTPVTLLAMDTRDERSTDWWNRGRLLDYQLQGQCLEYPEYSTLRHFKLRGMDLTLAYTDIGWEKGAKGPVVAKFTFTVDAMPDVDAKSPVAERPPGPIPPKSCYP